MRSTVSAAAATFADAPNATLLRLTCGKLVENAVLTIAVDG